MRKFFLAALLVATCALFGGWTASLAKDAEPRRDYEISFGTTRPNKVFERLLVDPTKAPGGFVRQTSSLTMLEFSSGQAKKWTYVRPVVIDGLGFVEKVTARALTDAEKEAKAVAAQPDPAPKSRCLSCHGGGGPAGGGDSTDPTGGRGDSSDPGFDSRDNPFGNGGDSTDPTGETQRRKKEAAEARAKAEAEGNASKAPFKGSGKGGVPFFVLETGRIPEEDLADKSTWTVVRIPFDEATRFSVTLSRKGRKARKDDLVLYFRLEQMIGPVEEDGEQKPFWGLVGVFTKDSD